MFFFFPVQNVRWGHGIGTFVTSGASVVQTGPECVQVPNGLIGIVKGEEETASTLTGKYDPRQRHKDTHFHTESDMSAAVKIQSALIKNGLL